MIWFWILFMRLTWTLVGAFGTAYLFERQGRDVTRGGLTGLVLGLLGGLPLLLFYWGFQAYGGSFLPAGQWNGHKRWHQWWL